MVEKKGDVCDIERECGVSGIQGNKDDAPNVDELCKGIQDLDVKKDVSETECDVNCECNADIPRVETEVANEPEAEVGNLSESIQQLTLDERGEGDGAEVEEKRRRDPQEDEVSESETESDESEVELSSSDVKEFMRADGPFELRDGHQLAQVGAKPLSSMDRCIAPKSQLHGKSEIVARAPDGGYPTARSTTGEYKRKGRHMTGGGIVGMNDTGMTLGHVDQQDVMKCRKPMAGDYSTTSRSRMTGGHVQGFPQLNDPLPMPPKNNVLPHIDAVWDRFVEPSLPNFPNLPHPAPPSEPQEYPNPPSVASSHEREVRRIEAQIRSEAEQLEYRPDRFESIGSPYGGSTGSGIGSPQYSVSSPGSVNSEATDRSHRQSESEEEVDGSRTQMALPFSLDDLEDIDEVIGKMSKSDAAGHQGNRSLLNAAPVPTTTSQESVLKSQLGQPPICVPTQMQMAAPPRAPIPPTTTVPTSTQGNIVLVVMPPAPVPVKKGPVPILPKTDGTVIKTTTMPVTQRKTRTSRKSKKSSKSSPPPPQSGSPKTGPDSVFFAPSPAGSTSSFDTLIGSPGSSQGVPSPGSAGLACSIPDVSRLGMTAQPAASMSAYQGVPTSFPQGTNSQFAQPPAGNTFNNTPQTMSANFPQYMTATMTTATPTISAASRVESRPISNQCEGEFQKPVAAPPQRKNNRPGLKIDTKGANASQPSNTSLTPVPASPSTPTTMSQKSLAFGTINRIPKETFLIINEDGDSLAHRFIAFGKVHETDATLARYKREGCLDDFLNLKNFDHQTPLYLAVLMNEVAIVKILLEYEADATITNKDSSSVLHCAAKRCQLGYEILDLLLTMPAKKLDLSIKDFEGMTPLHVAIQNHGKIVNDKAEVGNSLNTVDLLFQHGARAQDKASRDGRNALHFAIELRSPELIEKVLQYDNSKELVNDMMDSGHTGLHIAAGLPMDNIALKKRMIELLIKNGADLDARNREGKSPKDLVCDPKGVGLEIVKLLTINRSKNRTISGSSNPASPASPRQPQATGHTNQQTVQPAPRKQTQRMPATQGIPTTNTNVNNSNVLNNPSILGSFVDQMQPFGRGLCETSDNSLEEIVTSLPSLDFDSLDGSAAFTEGFNPQYSQVGAPQQPYTQTYPQAPNMQYPAYANQPIPTTSGSQQSYPATTSMYANQPTHTTSGSQQSYPATTSMYANQPMSAASSVSMNMPYATSTASNLSYSQTMNQPIETAQMNPPSYSQSLGINQMPAYPQMTANLMTQPNQYPTSQQVNTSQAYMQQGLQSANNNNWSTGMF